MPSGRWEPKALSRTIGLLIRQITQCITGGFQALLIFQHAKNTDVTGTTYPVAVRTKCITRGGRIGGNPNCERFRDRKTQVLNKPCQ